MTHMQVSPLKAILDNEGLNQWCALFAFCYFHCVLWRSLFVMIRRILACLTIGFQIVVSVYSAVLQMNLLVVYFYADA